MDLTHWGRVTHICAGDQGIIFSRKRRVAWSAPSHFLNQCWNVWIGLSGTNFSEILIEIHTFSFKKMFLKIPWPNMLTSLQRHSFYITGPLCGNPTVIGIFQLGKVTVMQTFDVFLLLSWKRGWKNCWVADGLRHYDAGMKSLYWFILTAKWALWVSEFCVWDQPMRDDVSV